MSKEDKIKELQVRIFDTKSRIISLATNIESQLDVIMAAYFSKNNDDYQLFCHLFYPIEVGLTFGIKIKIFENFINKIYPDYLEKINPDLINSLGRVRRLRNKFAHSINPKRVELGEILDKPYFILFYTEDGLMKNEQIMWNDIDDRFKDFENIVDESVKLMEYVQGLRRD